MVTPHIIDSFGHGIAGGAQPYHVYATSNGSPAIITSPVRTGTRALQIDTTSAAEWVGYTVGHQIVCMSFYIRFPTSLPGGTRTLAHFINASATGYITFNSSTSKLRVSMSSGTTASDFGPTLSADTWYLVDVEFDTSGTTFNLVARVDNNAATEGTATKTGVSATNTTSIRLGTNSVETVNAIYDDWVVSVTDGDYPIGPHSIEDLVPTSDGTHTNIPANTIEYTLTGTDITSSSTDVYTLVNERPLDNSTNGLIANLVDYVNIVGDATAPHYVEVQFENLATGSDVPVGVRAYDVDVDAAAGGTSLAVVRIVLDDGTSVSPDLRLSTDDADATPRLRQKVLTAPGGGWSRTNVNGLRARIGWGDGAPDTYVSSLMLDVLLVPGAQSAAITTATETDEAIALQRIRSLAVAMATETDSAIAITGVLTTDLRTTQVHLEADAYHDAPTIDTTQVYLEVDVMMEWWGWGVIIGE